ncbi:MAG: sensor histidine kinase [Candidatus Competibacterales bacterium]
MKIYRRSLRTRITIAFCFFGAVLGGVFSAIILNCFYLVEDWTIVRQMEIKLDDYSRELRADPQSALPASRSFTGYLGDSALPLSLAPLMKTLPAGVHELRDHLSTAAADYAFAQHYFVAVKPLNDDRRLYLVYDTRDLVASHDVIHRYLARLCIGATALVIVLGAVLGYCTSHTIISPLVRLARWVAAADPQAPPAPLVRFCGDEVGCLAYTISQFMERIAAFVERERRFTRNATHELRTRVRVMTGALELLESLPGAACPRAARALGRMHRALVGMEHTVAAFLCMAREVPDPDGDCDLTTVVQQVVEQHRELAQRKGLQVEVVAEGHCRVAASTAVVYVAVGNLVSNAFHYTDSGRVTIRVSRDGVSVEDTGVGIPKPLLARITEPHIRGARSQGYGLGLSIVTEFCERFGWRLQLQSQEGMGTQAQLRFG